MFEEETVDQGEYQIRIISTRETLENSPEVISMLERITPESQADLEVQLSKKGESLHNPITCDKFWKVDENFLDEFESTKKVIVVAEKDGVAQSAVLFSVNDPVSKENLGIKKDFLMIIKAFSEKSTRDTGYLSKLINFITTTVEAEIEPLYVTCLLAKEIARSDGTVYKTPLHLERYKGLYERKGFKDTSMQIRYIDSEGKQTGGEIYPIEGLDEEKVDKLLKGKCPEGKRIMGIYLLGDEKQKQKQSWVDRVKKNPPAERSRL